MDIFNLISFIGLFILIGVGWFLSSHRRIFNVRCVLWGTVSQLVFGAMIFLLPAGSKTFLFLSDIVVKMLSAATEGAKFCFGPLATPPGESGSLGFILVTQALPTIIFFASLMQVLYFLKIMPFVIRQFSRFFTRMLGVSGAESLCTAANIFVGIESNTTILPFLKNMTRSEICTIITGGLATIASSVLGMYVLLLYNHFPTIAGHLMSASILGAPAALVMSKLLLPETEQPETLGRVVEAHYEQESNVIEAAINGATAGGKLAMGVILMLMSFLGLVALINMGLDGFAGWLNHWTGAHLNLRLENVLAYLYYPFALIIGVPPADAFEVARLLGIRTIMTEVPAYQKLDALLASGTLHFGRSAVLASYALCGFAHIPSVAIFIGGTAALAPNQTRILAQVALRSLVAATLACLMIAAIAGVFYGRGLLVLNLKP